MSDAVGDDQNYWKPYNTRKDDRAEKVLLKQGTHDEGIRNLNSASEKVSSSSLPQSKSQGVVTRSQKRVSFMVQDMHNPRSDGVLTHDVPQKGLSSATVSNASALGDMIKEKAEDGDHLSRTLCEDTRPQLCRGNELLSATGVTKMMSAFSAIDWSEHENGDFYYNPVSKCYYNIDIADENFSAHIVEIGYRAVATGLRSSVDALQDPIWGDGKESEWCT